MKTIYKKDILSDDPFTLPEWLLTNGLGGYAYMSAPMTYTKSYHGLFTASLHPPVDRYSVLHGVIVDLQINNETYYLIDYLDHVIIDDTITYVYLLNHITIKQEISLVYNKNTFVMRYHITNPDRLTLHFYFKPVLSLRNPDDVNQHSPDYALFPYQNRLSIVPMERKDILIHMEMNPAVFTKDQVAYQPDNYTFHQKMGGGIKDHLSIPGAFESIIEEDYADICFSASLEDEEVNVLHEIEKEKLRIRNLTFTDDPTMNRLVKAADHFIVKRGQSKTIIAGYPWFTDWGRDTLISLEGLTLVTRRYDDAKAIIQTFIDHLKNGLCVNVFGFHDQSEILYNTADGSLWLIQAMYEYTQYTKDFSFVKKNFAALRSIISHYVTGTDHDIYMNDHFLLHAGSGNDQITWMDVRIDGTPVTPRHGYPVEINALWYNALCIMDYFNDQLNDNDPSYGILAKNCQKNFNKYFDTHKGYLYDVAPSDDTFRPNQLFALSLPFSPVDRKMAKSILEKAGERLYVGVGLRTLTPGHKDYHGIYQGEMKVRDQAYHQGTAWAYLLGPYLRADYRLYHNVARTRLLLEPLLKSMDEQCIDGLNEIADGDSPHIGKGCVNQAWSIGEALCIYNMIYTNEMR